MSAVTVKSLAQRKARRQKQILAVGSVVLLALLGFQLPKLLGRKSETAAPAVTTSSSVTGLSPAVPAGRLPDTGLVVVQRDANQLLSFGLFKSKDPFVQQLSTNASPPAATPAPAPAPATKRTTSKPKPASSPPLGIGLTPPATTTTPTTPATSTEPSNPPAGSAPSVSTPGAPGTTPATTTPAPANTPTEALLSTNGVCETVAVNGTFPADEDIFRVVSIAKDGKSVEIGVVGGSYDSGQATATLKRGEKLTLVNTADGTRYVIALQSKCNAQAQPSRTGTTGPVATTPVAAAPSTTTTTSSTTTPIVTDSLDTTAPPN
jgi:hypothetical protein